MQHTFFKKYINELFIDTINYDYSQIENKCFRRPPYTKSLIKNDKPYEYPQLKALFLTTLLFYNLIISIIRILSYSNIEKIIILIAIIIITDIVASFVHFHSDIKKTESHTRRPDFKNSFEKCKGKVYPQTKNNITTLHHLDVLDHLDMTTYELITWSYYVGADKAIYLCFLLNILPSSSLNKIGAILSPIVFLVIHFEYFHGAIHVHHKNRGKIPSTLSFLMDNNIMVSPHYHSLHHSKSDRNWSVFLGLFDKIIEKIAKKMKIIDTIENINPTIIDAKKDYRMCVPPLWKFWTHFFQDILYDKKFNPQNSWAYAKK